MLLIADSGSTKCDWHFVDDNNKIHHYKTSGFNPYFMNTDQILSVLLNDLAKKIKFNLVKEVFFYGAGCSSAEMCGIVEIALQSCFPKANIEVNHDLLGTARALCGKEPGIVGILGTGSNSCSYNGQNIAMNVPSLGYILGDEGSGAVLGKKLLAKYFYKELTENLANLFRQKFHISREQVLDAVYNKERPNKWLASFCPFIHEHIKHSQMREIVYDGFLDFFERHICKYPDYTSSKLFCTGSIAFHFKEILHQVAERKEIQIAAIVENPINRLTLFHTQSYSV